MKKGGLMKNSINNRKEKIPFLYKLLFLPISILPALPVLLVLATNFLLNACTVAPKMSPQQIRAMQMRTFESASYETVFRAFKTVLQDEGYIIKNQDMKGGLILANIQKSTSSGSWFWITLANPHNNRYQRPSGDLYEISINLEPINQTTTEVRTTIQQISQYDGTKNGQIILDPQMYKTFYQKVMIEIERRKARGRK